MLEINNIDVETKEGKKILKDFSLTINKGEIHILMGRNAAGKSTLLNAIMGNSEYVVTKGSIVFLGEDITNYSPDKRARLGIFLSFQNPEEIEGIKLSEFIRLAKEKVNNEKINLLDFGMNFQKEVKNLEISNEMSKRFVNFGFSGGEKKKSEMLQLKMLNPKFAMLDEIDSGLDIDAVKVVSKNIEEYMSQEKAMLIVTHHAEIFKKIVPTHVHILKDGHIVKSGDKRLLKKLEELGFEETINEKD